MKHCRAPVMLTRHDLSVRARLAQRKARSIWPGQVSGGHIRPSRFDESFADFAVTAGGAIRQPQRVAKRPAR